MNYQKCLKCGKLFSANSFKGNCDKCGNTDSKAFMVTANSNEPNEPYDHAKESKFQYDAINRRIEIDTLQEEIIKAYVEPVKGVICENCGIAIMKPCGTCPACRYRGDC